MRRYPQHAQASWTSQVAPGRPNQPDLLCVPLVSLGPAVSQWFTDYKKTFIVTMDLCSMGICSVTMVSFGSTVSQWTIDYRRPLCVTLELWFHAILQCLNEPLGQWGSKTSQWPLGSTKPCSVTMVSFGSRVSQWTTDDMRHPMSQRTFGFLGSCSVTKAS